MAAFERYAIYFTPQGSLAKAGAAWLGWDMAAGQVVPHPVLAGFDLNKLTERPRKYGLHGTLKPPFVLAADHDADSLRNAVEFFAKRMVPVRLEGLEIAPLGPFLALKPVGDTAALAALAAQVVMDLDRFRAPPSEAEVARRRQSRLTSVQEAHLVRWGYPYVMDAFQFHITLTGRISREDEAEILPQARAYFAPHLTAPFMINSLTLAGQAADGMFYEIERFKF